MKNESIIYFAKEWNQDRTSCDHVFEQLAKHNKVVWVNSIGMRNPNLSSSHDLKRIASKLRKCLGGLQQIGATAWVYQPIVIPLPYSAMAQQINRTLLRWSLRRIIRKLGMAHPQLWTFLPNAGYMVGQLDESVVVYYCIDEWSSFSFYDSQKIVALERELLAKADICFATAHSLLASRKANNPNTFLALHGVDYKHFSRALDDATTPPPDIASLPHPIVGFFGIIHEWIDLEVIRCLARSHPEWSIVLIGKSMLDLSSLREFPNVHVMGRRPYETLPAYCRAFDAAIIPFCVNDLTRSVNPIKLREYLSAGLPVVSTDLPEVKHFGDLVYIAGSPEEFVRRANQALQEDSPDNRRRRSDAMRHETWEHKAARICEQVMQAKASRKTQHSQL